MSRLAQLRRVWPTVIHDRMALFLVGEAFLALSILIAMLLLGEAPTRVVKASVTYPCMLLVAIAASDIVASLRRSGDLELLVTSASPARGLLMRLVPAVLLGVAQLLVSSLVVACVVGPVAAAAGLGFSILPLVFAAAVSLYWNLRLGSAAGVLGATLGCLLFAVAWIEPAQLLRESENYHLATVTLRLSLLRCELGLALASLGAAGLGRARLERTEDLLDA